MSQADHYGFSKVPLTISFNTYDYDGGIQNWDIAENRQGFIYVANNFGLLEYDGSHWQRYNIENNTRVRSVFTDADGRIYIGGQNQLGYFEPDSIGQLTFHTLRNALPEEAPALEDVWKIIRYQDQILFCSYEGIIALEDGTLSYLPQTENFDLAFEVANRLYSYSAIHGLAIWNGASFEPIHGSEFLKNDPITAIVPHRNNSMLVFQKNGAIYCYEHGTFMPWHVASDFFQESQINCARLLHNHNIAVGTQNNGLIILSQEGEILRHLTKGKGLNNPTVLALHEDQFHNLWAGMNNGISMVELGSPFSLVDDQSGLPGTGYGAAFYNGKIYLGTSNGLFYQQAHPDPISEAANTYKLIANTNGQVYNVQVINDLLLLAHHNGAFWVEGSEAYRFSELGTWKFTKRVNDYRIIAGTYEGFECFDLRNPHHAIGQSLGSFRESSRVFEFENDTTLFMTHGYKGVYRLGLNPETDAIETIRFYGADKGFPSNLLINVFHLGTGLVFAGETGLYRYEPETDRFVHDVTLEQYLGTDVHVSELSTDLKGNLFYLTDANLGMLQRTAFGEYEEHPAAFSRIRKYLSDDLENITVIDHQNVFFGAKEGFIHFNPSIETGQKQPFRTYIRRVTTDSEGVLYGGGFETSKNTKEASLPAYFASLKFRFAAPFFDGQSELLFQYQLENFDKDWSEWTPLTEKEYTNLSAGTYTFRVRSKNVYDAISEEGTFSFKVYPPWYLSRTAYTCYALLILLVFGFSLKLLDIRYKREKERLALSQRQELLKKDHEIVAVSKKSEAEITRLKNDKLRAEIDHKNRELATTTMHLITKNEFMLSLRDAVKEIAKNGSKEAIKKIVRDIDRNLSEDEGWEQFTRHFDQVHGDFLASIKKDHPALTPQEIKLCAYLRMNMSSKEIANLLNISVRGVEISRYRLRKKLNISRDTNLVDFMMAY